MFGHFGDHVGHFFSILAPKLKAVADYSSNHSKRPQKDQNSNGESPLEMTLEVIFKRFFFDHSLGELSGCAIFHLFSNYVIWGHLWPFLAVLAQKLKFFTN